MDASIGPIVVHGAVESLNRVYREAEVKLPATRAATEVDAAAIGQALAPPSAQGTPWMRHFGNYLGAAATQHVTAQPLHPASDTDS